VQRHEVKKSQWGLGVFAAEPVKKKEFVAGPSFRFENSANTNIPQEYTGELVSASTFNENRQ
jgi:hypothetical protein